MGKSEIITKLNSDVDKIGVKLAAIDLSANLENEVYDAELSQIIDSLTQLESFSDAQIPAANIKIPSIPDQLNIHELKALREQLVVAKMQIESARDIAERIMCEASAIKLSVEAEKAMLKAEIELERAKFTEENNVKQKQILADKKRLSEKIAKRKAEITAVRNGLKDVKDTASAFLLREKLFSIQLVLDDEERASPDIVYLLSKSMDDINHAVDMSELKRRIASLNKRLTKEQSPITDTKISPIRKTSQTFPLKQKPASRQKSSTCNNFVR